MAFNAPDKQYQAELDKIIDAPLVGRFQVDDGGKVLIDPGLIERSLELMEPFITREADRIDDNFRREKTWLYPFEAVRELLINGLVHRDWTRFTDIEIAGYSERLEIISPGSLPNSMTVEKMLAGQRSARNSIVVEVMRDYGYVDARGMGVRTKVVPALMKNGLKPEFEVTEDYVRSVIYKTKEPSEPPFVTTPSVSYGDMETSDVFNRKVPAKTSDLILYYLKSDPAMTLAELAGKIGKSLSAVERAASKLSKAGRLKRVGSKKSGHWEVKG